MTIFIHSQYHSSFVWQKSESLKAAVLLPALRISVCKHILIKGREVTGLSTYAATLEQRERALCIYGIANRKGEHLSIGALRKLARTDMTAKLDALS